MLSYTFRLKYAGFIEELSGELDSVNLVRLKIIPEEGVDLKLITLPGETLLNGNIIQCNLVEEGWKSLCFQYRGYQYSFIVIDGGLVRDVRMMS